VTASVGDDRLPDPARVLLDRRIEWIDTDAAGIYHWTTAFRLAEAAEAALHTALGIVEQTFGVTPRVAASARFLRALRFNEAVAVELAVEAIGRTSLTYRLAIGGDAGPAVEGTLTIVHVERVGGGAAPWPPEVRERLASGGLQPEP
jgi:acyl-CoA thioester hydrolase